MHFWYMYLEISEPRQCVPEEKKIMAKHKYQNEYILLDDEIHMSGNLCFCAFI